MSKKSSIGTVSLFTCGLLLLSTHVFAADTTKIACNVVVDYLLNNTLSQTYQKAFVVEPGVSFSDDFSTPTRLREFTASTVLDAGKTVVGIRYFNDVGVFDSIDFSTKLTLVKGGGAIQSTSGSMTFSSSLTSSRNHTANYTLTCRQLKQ